MYQWFTGWIDQHLALTITLARTTDSSDDVILDAFDADTGSIVVASFDEADDDPGAPRVRIGRHGDWYYAVEHFSIVGASDETLRRLAAGPEGEAYSLACNTALNSFQSAHHGRVTTRLDLSLPTFRYGAEPDRYLNEITEVGLLAGTPNTSASGAELLTQVTGMQVHPETIERPLLSAILGRTM